jgi:hypothetical protein
MFSNSEAMSNTSCVQENGVNKVLVHIRAVPIGFPRMEKVL